MKNVCFSKILLKFLKMFFNFVECLEDSYDQESNESGLKKKYYEIIFLCPPPPPTYHLLYSNINQVYGLMRRSRSQEHFDFKNFAIQKYQKIIEIVNIFLTLKISRSKKYFALKSPMKNVLQCLCFYVKMSLKLKK